MKLFSATIVALLLCAGCTSDGRAPGQWPIEKSELLKSAHPAAPGEGTYRRYCVSCHGEDGRGNGGITGADFVGTAAVLSEKPDAQLVASVRDGKRGERAVMPAHRPVLTDAQLDEVVAYVRQRFMQPSSTPTASP